MASPLRSAGASASKRPRLAPTSQELVSHSWGPLLSDSSAVPSWGCARPSLEQPRGGQAEGAGTATLTSSTGGGPECHESLASASSSCPAAPPAAGTPLAAPAALVDADVAEQQQSGCAAVGEASVAPLGPTLSGGGGASSPSRASSKRKRAPDDFSWLCELPPKEAEAVGVALEQWGRLRHRVKALEPTLRREGALVQEILDTGLRDENRRTLRKLTQSSANGDVEETIQQVGKAIGANRERLERILERNHGELVRLSTTAVSDLKEEVLREVDEVLQRLKCALAGVRAELLGAKSRADMTAVRRTGRSFNDLKALVRRLDDERRLITRNSALAALLVTVCRRVLPVRHVEPSDLRDIPPSCDGYRRIMDFYFFTDASLYFFGDYTSGPNWFVRLKRNVAILLVQDVSGKVVYNHFAVSGECRAPGAPPAPSCGGPLRSTEAEDEHGRVFNRQHDAEFKLLCGFCLFMAETLGLGSEGAATWEGTGTLWSRKPICSSCLGAVRQLAALFPNLQLSVSVGSLTQGDERRPAVDAAEPSVESGAAMVPEGGTAAAASSAEPVPSAG